MDILDFLTRNRTNPFVGYGLAAIGIILIWVGRGIYFSLFPSKRTWHTKSFKEEEEENQGKPISHPESIGSISGRLGADVREVLEMGYSNDQINGVLTGKYTLEEMYKMKPAGDNEVPPVGDILANVRRRTK